MSPEPFGARPQVQSLPLITAGGPKSGMKWSHTDSDLCERKLRPGAHASVPAAAHGRTLPLPLGPVGALPTPCSSEHDSRSGLLGSPQDTTL